jgi:excisionase family DNA binding protein
MKKLDEAGVGVRIDPFSYPPRGMSREEAARYIGVGTTKFDEMVADRRMPRPKKIDGRVVWDRIALDAAFSDLPLDGGDPIDQILGGRKQPTWGTSPSAPEDRRPFTPRRLAERWACSERHIRNMLKRGDLPVHHFGGKLIRISWEDVIRFEDDQIRASQPRRG